MLILIEGPKNRAPLGNKATNAKAAAFRTPAPKEDSTTKPSSIRPTSPRLRRGKVQIHTETVPNVLSEDESEPDIEYMPPRSVPLPDYPDDWPHDRTYPQFQGANLTKGWWSEIDPHAGETEEEQGIREQQEFLATLKKIEERERKQKLEEEEKSAASLLAAEKTQERKMPGFAAPTAAARARQPTAKKPLVVGNGRHTAAKVASNTTLGYSKGRAVSAGARVPLSSIHEKPNASDKIAEKESQKPTLKTSRLHLERDEPQIGNNIDDDEDDGLGSLFKKTNLALAEVEEELDDFRLESVEV